MRSSAATNPKAGSWQASPHRRHSFVGSREKLSNVTMLLPLQADGLSLRANKLSTGSVTDLTLLTLDGFEVLVVVTLSFAPLFVRVHVTAEFQVLLVRQKKEFAIGAAG